MDEALTFFKQYMTENNIDLVTFFQGMDEDGSMAVSYDEFREGLRVSIIKNCLELSFLIAVPINGDLVIRMYVQLFTLLFQAAKIPLTPLQVDQLISALDQDGDGEIDFG